VSSSLANWGWKNPLGSASVGTVAIYGGGCWKNPLGSVLVETAASSVGIVAVYGGGGSLRRHRFGFKSHIRCCRGGLF